MEVKTNKIVFKTEASVLQGKSNSGGRQISRNTHSGTALQGSAPRAFGRRPEVISGKLLQCVLALKGVRHLLRLRSEQRLEDTRVKITVNIQNSQSYLSRAHPCLLPVWLTLLGPTWLFKAIHANT